VVTYAVVDKTPQPPAAATTLKNLLTNLVSFSHTGSLPFGYAPLPTAMYQAAISEINSAVVAQPTTEKPTTTPATSGSPAGSATGGSSTTGSDGLSGASSTDFSSTLPLSGSAGSAGNGGANGGGKGNSGTSTASNGSSLPTGLLLVSLAEATRFLLPAIVLLALASLIGGSLLLFGPGARRRRESEVPE
jgi:hypothetical protein